MVQAAQYVREKQLDKAVEVLEVKMHTDFENDKL